MRLRHLAFVLVCQVGFGLLVATAQSPIALPTTMTTIGGQTPTSGASGSQCPGLPASMKSSNADGDGCLASSLVLGAGIHGGAVVDSMGNVFIDDDVKGVLHLIDQATGMVTVAAGGGTTCSAKVTGAGDGCLAATQTSLNGQRGVGMDPYGNVLLAGYGDGLLHVVCRVASPLCTATQLGTMQMLAGCVVTMGGNSTGSSATLIGLSNLPAKVVGTACTSTSGGVLASPRGVSADIYGNVFFADTNTSRYRVVLGPQTSSYFTGANPLYAALSVYYPSLTAGYFYSIVNTLDSAACDATYTTACGGSANSPSAVGMACSVTTNGTTYSGVSTDVYGDGCPFEFSSVTSSSGYTTGEAADAAGNFIFSDHGTRVLFVSGVGTAGAAMANAIKVNNPGVTPQPGFVYRLVGGGSTTTTTTPILGTSSSYSSSGSGRVTVSPQGNIYQVDGGNVYFFDINTGYVRLLFSSSNNAAAGASCGAGVAQTSLSAYSDGCPASDSKFSAVNASVDSQGNLYMVDSGSNTTNNIVRKVLAQGFASETVGTPLTQTFEVHLPETVSGSVSTSGATKTANADISISALSASSCVQNTDKSVDCKISATATPSAPGERSTDITVTLPSATSWTNSAMTINLSGNASGSALVVDSGATTVSGTTTAIAPTTATVFSNIAAAGVAADGAGNIYVMDKTSGKVLESIGGVVSTISTSSPSTPKQIAVDALGNIFSVGSGTPTIQELQTSSAGSPAVYAATSLAYTPASGTPTPYAVAVDAVGNIYVADYQSGGASIYKLSQAANTLQTQMTVATGLNIPVSLAVDASGNIYAADQGAHAVLKFTPGINAGVYSYASSILLGNVTPASVAVDAAGDLYVQDAASGSVIEVPVSGPTSVTVLTGVSAPSGLAVDGQGNVYSADLSATAVTKVIRNATTEDFGTSTSTAYTATLTNVGNLAVTGQNTSSSNTINFNIVGGPSAGCAVSSNVLGAMAPGAACTLSANLSGSGTTVVDDYLSFLPSASTIGVLTLQGQLQGTSYPTSTSISGPSQTAPTYTANGTEATFTVTVTSGTAPSSPVGTVNVYVDSTTSFTQYNLSQSTAIASTATVQLSGLSAGAHTIAVVYPTTGMFTGSGTVSNTSSFTIVPTGTIVSWTPAAMSQSVSAAIGTSVLNPTAQPAIAGNFIYSITASPICTGTNGGTINSATYLPIGAYTLYATFCPTDANDYNSSSASVSNFTVVQASTTAAVGASTNVVAADGTGNYTTLSAALVALPAMGGTIYIKPGTYTGQNAISYPNVYLRGLGGDSTKVVLTAEEGAFSNPFTGYLGTGTGAGNANASGDQGSSTLDVSSGIYMGQTAGSTPQPIGSQGSSHAPNNFYAEYLTIQNTWDFSSTQSNYIYNGSACVQGAATALQTLYNNGQECAAQALAVWITADQAILNNVNLYSQQDTILAGSQGCNATTCTSAREYMWKGLISGNVDYVFGDAALVFDHTTFFTTYHGSTTGTETIEAQNKHFPTGSSGDYLSGYICNGCTLLSQAPGMSSLFYGRPYGLYSTWIMLDSAVDQVAPVGWIEFSGNSNLPTSTYGEYNTMPYTDPAVGTSIYPSKINALTPVGGNSGAGATSFSSRETTSSSPGTLQATNTNPRLLTAAQAAQYYPINFLSTPLAPANLPSGQPASWNPVTDLATRINAFAPVTAIAGQTPGTSITILGRPQTPGAGVVPTGNYSFYDSLGMNQVCTAAGGTCTLLASGTLDASGEAYLTTGTATGNALAVGTHYITFTYGGDANFAASTSVTYAVPVASQVINTAAALSVATTASTYGGTINGTVTVTAASGTAAPNGTVELMSGSTGIGSCTLVAKSTLASGCSFALTGVAAGLQTMTAVYASTGSGSAAFGASTSAGVLFSIAPAVLQVTANNATVAYSSTGTAIPAFTFSTSGYVNFDTSSVLSGTPALTTSATPSSPVGEYPIVASTGTLQAGNYSFIFSSGYLSITETSQAPAVATGDTRNVTEPVFPGTCQQLQAAILMVNNDIPASAEATVTNPDGARIQAALNACSGTGQSVRLSMDGAGNNAFLTGPLSMPTNVTLLVDPGVVLFFSRNAQDYDLVAGTHQCGNISTASNVCKPMIDIPKTDTNVGIMGYGKIDGRSGDPLINAVPPYQGFSWLALAAAYTSANAAQVPKFVDIETGSTNITLYKITIRNSPNYHIGDGAMNSTIWGVKLITPTTGRNTDGIDTGNSNITITRSWISAGDDDVAIGAPNEPANNISVTHNHIFAGHGESIGSYTGDGVNNVLFDGNILAGNGYAGVGSTVSATGTFAGGVADTNSAAVHIKTADDRGGVITNIQYSNSCILDHTGDVSFMTQYGGTTTGNSVPNINKILLQNLVFLNDYPTASTGNLQFQGGTNGTVTYPIQVTLDNVTFAPAVNAAAFVAGGQTNGQLTYGPGQVSSNFVTAWNSFVGVSANADTVTDHRTASSLTPPACSFTYIAPELTGAGGLPQSIIQGQNTSAISIMTPAVGGALYPTGTVTLTDAATGSAYIAPLTGSTDTVTIPLTGLAVGTHTLNVTYSGDSNYVKPSGASSYTTAGPYTITVNPGSLPATTTGVSLSAPSESSGLGITATATVVGNSPTGTVQFVVNGGGLTGSYTYSTINLTGGSASSSIGLPYSTTAYTIDAVYSGDNVNAGSSSAGAKLQVTPALTATMLSANTTTVSLGAPVLINATVSSAVGTPAGTVSLSYTTSTNSSPVSLGTNTLLNGAAEFDAQLPIGSYNLAASYVSAGAFAASTSTPLAISVTSRTSTALSSAPFALPYTITTLAGGANVTVPSTGVMNCAGATDKYGDGCQATSIALPAGTDLRGVAADPFGNVYYTETAAGLIRKITPNGTIVNFAGFVSGTACPAPAATSALNSGCVSTTVSMNKPRGVSSDAAGNIFIADYSGGRVYEVKASDGLMYTLAGTGLGGSAGDGGPAISATLNAPRGAWGDPLGNVYIADTTNNKIRVVDANGDIHTVVGTGTNSSTGDGGTAISATISNPQGVIVDQNLNLYVADGGGNIRVVCVSCGTGSPLDSLLTKLGINSPVNGYIYTVAGNGTTTAYAYSAPVKSTSVSMAPQKLGIDASGNLYISDSNGYIWFLDMKTAYMRAIAMNATTVCATATDSLGDGCNATQGKFSSNGGGIGVAVDPLGNMYFSDNLDLRIRKVSTNLPSPSTPVGSTAILPLQIHYAASDSPASSNAFSYPGSEWSLSVATPCTTNGDSTMDCAVTSTFSPAVPGVRSTPLTLNTTAGSTASLALTGSATGAGATLDPAAHISFGTALTIAGLAVDSGGNVYVSDSASHNVYRYAKSAIANGTSAAKTSLVTLVSPGAVTVDTAGNVYVADTSVGTVTKITASGVVSTLSPTFKKPAGLTTDSIGNLYVSDATTATVYGMNPSTGALKALALGTLTSPQGLSIDANGALIVADAAGPAVYRFNLSTNARTTVTSSVTAPINAVTDAANNLLIADGAQITALPASSNSAAFAVASFAPPALAIDSAGNLYTGQAGSVLELQRTNGYVQFPAQGATPQTVNMLESGNVAFTGTSFGQSDTVDYVLTTTSSADCSLSNTGAGTLAVGGVCSLTASTTATNATTPDTVTFNGNLTNAALSSPSSVQLVLNGPSIAPTATIALGAFAPTAPVYGQTVSVSATVSGMPIMPTGTVALSVDGKVAAPITLVNGVATATLTGLAAGMHTIIASYTSTDGFASVSTTAVTLTVAKTAPSAALTVSPTVLSGGAPQGVSQTFMVTVSGGVSPTGTVTFYDGSAALSTAIALANGTASYTSATLPVGSHNITGQYSGDTNNNSATSAVLTFKTVSSLAPGFSLSAPTTPMIVVAAGSTGALSFTVTPGANYGGTVTFSCPGAPSGLTCSFAPASLTFLPSSGAAQNETFTIAASSSAELIPLFAKSNGRTLAFLLGIPSVLLLLPCRRHKRYKRALGTLMLAVLVSVLSIGASGCGGRGMTTQQPKLYTVTVTGTDGTNSQSFTVNVTVTH